MKQLTFLFLLTTFTLKAQQKPIVYVNFVSHNEPDDSLDLGSNYAPMKALVLQLADTINTKGAAWNLQTCADFAKGARQNESPSNNLFRTLAGTPYIDNIEIDVRYKDNIFGTLADLYHVLGELGANRTHTLGGFLSDTADADWFQYESPQLSTSPFYPQESWQCQIMWGAASLNHTNDIDDWGVWRPDNVTTFYTHNPARPVLYIGNGCSPDGTIFPANPGSFDPTDNVTDVINPLRRLIDSIANNQLPWDKFYNYSITINQSGFGNTLFSKIALICDSINAMDTSNVQWSLLTDRLNKYQNWTGSNSSIFSQWECGAIYVSVEENSINEIQLYPNPTNDILTIKPMDGMAHSINVYNLIGDKITALNFENETTISTANWKNGFYFITNENGNTQKLQVLHE